MKHIRTSCKSSKWASSYGPVCAVCCLLCVACFNCSPPSQTSGWSKTYGGTSYDCGRCVRQTSDVGYIVAGETYSSGPAPTNGSSFYLIKTDASGETLWTRAYGPYASGYSVEQTPDGGYISVGNTSYLSAGYTDVYLIKTDAHGITVWTRTYGGEHYDWGHDVRRTSDGGYIVVGVTSFSNTGGGDIYLLKVNDQGDTLWTRTYGGANVDARYSVRRTSDGGYIIVGGTQWSGAGGFDVYLIKTNAQGDSLWTRTYGGTDDDAGYSVEQTKDGGYIVAGCTYSFGQGTPAYDNVYLIKTNAQGDTLWTRTYGGANYDEGRSVQQTSDDGYIVVGSTNSFGAGISDVYLIKTDGQGDTLWTRTFGGPSGDFGYSVQQTSDGGYIIAGQALSFGAGEGDVYLIKTNADGNIK